MLEIKLLKCLDTKSHCEGDEPPVGPPASWLVEGRYTQKTFWSGRKNPFLLSVGFASNVNRCGVGTLIHNNFLHHMVGFFKVIILRH
jgi:hypothetical protein